MNGYAQLLVPLTRLPGVQGALVADGLDGVVVAADMRVPESAPRVAAFAAALARRLGRAMRGAGLGDAGFLQLEAERARLCALERGGLVLVVLADPDTNVGLLRAELRRAADALP